MMSGRSQAQHYRNDRCFLINPALWSPMARWAAALEPRKTVSVFLLILAAFGGACASDDDSNGGQTTVDAVVNEDIAGDVGDVGDISLDVEQPSDTEADGKPNDDTTSSDIGNDIEVTEDIVADVIADSVEDVAPDLGNGDTGSSDSWDDADGTTDATDITADVFEDTGADIVLDPDLDTGEDVPPAPDSGSTDAGTDEDVYVPPTFKCKKDGDCVLQFPDLPACEKAHCNLDTGVCGVIVLENGSLCADGDPCSLGDSCQDGICIPLSYDCDDNNSCTDDVCFPGLACVNQKNLNPCDDGDSCTLSDHCQDGACTGAPINCNDQDSCTNDFCVDSKCVHQVVQTDSCCFIDVISWKFDDATLQGWIANNSSDKVGWTVSELQAASKPNALYYGHNKDQSYVGDGGPHTGSISSPSILMPTAGAISISFQLFLDVEFSADKDMLDLYAIDEAGKKYPLWHKTASTPQKEFVEVQADLSEFSGQVIKLQFVFNTVDGFENKGLGVFVDDVYVFSSCPVLPCEEDTECNDGVVCTVDTCEALQCQYVVIDGCCSSNFECDDGNVCTTDICQNNSCANVYNTKSCNDKDPCTIKDKCGDGVCIGEPLNCNDKDDCTVDTCIGGACTYAASEELECCGYPITTWDFPNFDLPNWKIKAAPAPDAPQWKVTNSRAASFPYALHLGNNGKQVSTQGAVNTTIESPLTTVPLAPDLKLNFWMYLDLAPEATADVVTINGISPKGKVVQIWKKPASFPMKTWTWISADASFFIPEGGVQIQVVFDSVDAMNSGGEGLYLDDIQLHVPCPNIACLPGDVTPCDDGNPATTDSCDGALCVSLPKLWYCEVDEACDDEKQCTDQLCYENICQILEIGDCCEDDPSCDDGNLCTTDICNDFDGCAYEANALPCDDVDACTEFDTCADGVCGGAPVDCDDGTGCTSSVCTADTCVYEFLNLPGCCDKFEAEHDFGIPLTDSGFSVTGTSTKVKWQTSPAKYTSGPTALYYGNPAQQSYETAGAKNSGTVTTPPVWLPNAIVTSANFLLYMDVEQGATYDVLTMQVVVGTGDNQVVTDVWKKPSNFVMQKFHPISVDLGAWAGKTVRLRYVFDTIDSAANNREGVYIDDLRLYVNCPQTICQTGADCDDEHVCTTDQCVAGICVHAPVAGCCEIDTDCDDFNFCTTDQCSGGTCGHVTTPGCCFSSSDCEDGNVCTDDICDPTIGCVHVNNTGFCSDGDACTKNDKCLAGVCSGTPTICDDGDDLCTTDVCKNGTCIFQPTGAKGCCKVKADCNDGDSCTEDSCEDGVCVSINLCCKSDAECDDGDNLCTLDKCIGGDCVYQQTNAPGCCVPQVYKEIFVSAAATPFTYQGTSASAKWQVSTSGKSQSAPGALYYGNPASKNFDAGATNGTATSPLISLPNKATITLTFWVYMDTESGSTYDQLFLYAKDGGVQTTIWDKSKYTSMLTWQKQTVSLANYKGKSIQLAWYFNTVDSVANGGEGVYIDDVEITIPCP